MAIYDPVSEIPGIQGDRMPIRIQRLRSKGWTMPANAIYVGRPTIWGNPFKVGAVGISTAEFAVRLYRDIIHGWNPATVAHLTDAELLAVYHLTTDWRDRLRLNAGCQALEAVRQLRGHDLACWCPVDAEWCHADVLLELANK